MTPDSISLSVLSSDEAESCAGPVQVVEIQAVPRWHMFCCKPPPYERFAKTSDEKGGEELMELLKRLLVEEDGQGLVEYTLIVVLVALVFWVAINNTDIGNGLASGWSKVTDCVENPAACNSSS